LLTTHHYHFDFNSTQLGKKSVDSSFEDYGEKYGDNDVIGCFLDLESTPRTISYSKNGKYLGIAFTIPGTMTGSVFFPAIVVKGAGAVFNFGATGFRFFDASKGENRKLSCSD
jgi:hypothetical protein